MIVLVLPSRAKGVTSVTIVTNLVTKLTDVMPYIVVLLNLLRLLKLLLCNLLLWTILLKRASFVVNQTSSKGMEVPKGYLAVYAGEKMK